MARDTKSDLLTSGGGGADNVIVFYTGCGADSIADLTTGAGSADQITLTSVALAAFHEDDFGFL